MDRNGTISENLTSHVRGYSRNLHRLSSLLESPGARAAASGALLITREAGIGKTHLLCHLAEERVRAGSPTLLVLGGQLGEGQAWQRVASALGLGKVDEIDLLSAFDAAAEDAGEPVLLLIDALNEGAGRRLWHDQLAGFLETLSEFSSIRVALSVRTSYRRALISDSSEERLEVVEHRGLGESGPEAMQSYFRAFGLKLPPTPFIGPEYDNPLFLRLLCQGLRNQGLDSLPPGGTGPRRILTSSSGQPTMLSHRLHRGR